MKVLVYPNPLLRVPADPVLPTRISEPEFQDKCMKLVDIMLVNKALGLAATQIGWSERVFAMMSDTGAALHINPIILGQTADMVRRLEACLSFPGVEEYVASPAGVWLQSQDMSGELKQYKLTDRYAQCAFHEVDHLDGKLMIDRMNRHDRLKFLKRMRHK